ncbi:hypothetical protein D6792_01665 [Candidatus Parcubacteria bacterium]|nr:MAG: hypothetical protein D6792_01665 [Candidatus Parcubacteria bacterium]GIW68736.1 MAG: hypothetical protein KatS3mg100_230 [Candidatus Parcubacteria bacterium]
MTRSHHTREKVTAESRLTTAGGRWLGLFAAGAIIGSLFTSLLQNPARGVVGSPAGMCADSATNIALLQDLRDRIAASTDPDELRRLTQEFYSLRTHNRDNIQAAKNKSTFEKERDRLLGRIAAIQSNPATSAYAEELDALKQQTETAKTMQDLLPVSNRVSFIETLTSISSLVGTETGTGNNTPGGGTDLPGSGWAPNIKEELPPAEREIVVRTVDQLRSAVANARPGDHIILEDGTYNEPITVSAQGTPDHPIVIRARNILGAHLARGITLTENSRNIWVYGVDLKDSRSNVSGENHVFRRVRIWPAFNNGQSSIGLSFTNGKNARVDYCELRLYTTEEVRRLYGKVWDNPSAGGAIRSVFQDDTDWFDNVTIERCLLTGGPSGVPYHAPNIQFIEAQGPSGSFAKLRDTHQINWVMRYLYGDVSRDLTVIDLKQGGMHIVDSHIKSQGGAIQVRHGCCHSIRNSRFENTTVAINGPNHVIENVVGDIRVLAGDVPWTHWEVTNGPHQQAYNVALRNTTGNLRIGHQYSSEFRYPALNTTVEGHEGPLSFGLHENTTVRETSSIPKTDPPRLSPSVVGPFAPWVGIAP